MKDRNNKLSNISLVDAKLFTLEKLNTRGVTVNSMAQVVYDYMIKYKLDFSIDDCESCILEILNKRETLHKILLGISIDEACENNHMDPYTLSVVNSDDGLFGVDELFGISISDLYGSAGCNLFGYFDKVKPGIINDLDTSSEQVNTFLDDLVCGICAASCSKLIHSKMNIDDSFESKNEIISQLNKLGVHLIDIAEVVFNEQLKYSPDLTLQYCIDSLNSILNKREVLSTIALSLYLNKLYIDDKTHFESLFMANDNDLDKLFSPNKPLSMHIAKLYGSIGYSNLGFFYETKPGIIKSLESNPNISFYLLDIICALASAVSGRIAHNYRDLRY